MDNDLLEGPDNWSVRRQRVAEQTFTMGDAIKAMNWIRGGLNTLTNASVTIEFDGEKLDVSIVTEEGR